MRIALGVEYDGIAFAGWQSQRRTRTVQETLEAALARVADHPVRVVCAGRTDAGVHATAQVVHFDTESVRPERAWVLGTNSHLPADVAVRWARAVEPRFHARFTARGRRYRYVILNRDTRPALLRGRVWWVHRPLDAEPARAAAAYLVGEHDFTSFRALACQARHPVRTIRRLDVHRAGEFLFIDVSANAFLHHMVRNLAGVLAAIARGEHPPQWAREVLEARDRALGGVTAPAAGLYLVQVEYPEAFGLDCGVRLPALGGREA